MTDLERLQALLVRQLADMGWNDAGIYNRDWKKAAAETKRKIKQLEKNHDPV